MDTNRGMKCMNVVLISKLGVHDVRKVADHEGHHSNGRGNVGSSEE